MTTGSNTMELDDMKVAWRELSQRLDAQAALNLGALKSDKLDTMRRGLRPLAWGQAIQIVIGVLVAVWGANFWIAHRDVTHLLVAGLMVHAAGVSMIALGVLMEVLIARIDYAAPVLVIQRQFAQLRKAYVVGGLAVGLPWWVLWVPFGLVLFGTLGVDVYAHAPSAVWMNVAAGVGGMLATWGFLHWARTRPKLAKWLSDGAAGTRITRAQARLDEIARFEQE